MLAEGNDLHGESDGLLSIYPVSYTQGPTKNAPVTGSWGACLSMRMGAVRLLPAMDSAGHLWAQGYEQQWRDWVQFATATPPQEYDLPLAAGYTKAAGHACNYSMAQDGTVLVHIAIGHTSGTLPTGYLQAASLPAGYWPKEIIGHQYNASEGAYINPDGGIFYILTDARKTLIDTLEFRTT